MKKIISLLILTCLVVGCSTTQDTTVVYRTDNYNRLEVGMSKREVQYWIGSPERYLQSTTTRYGYVEVLLYRNRYSEYFALEFVNDYLVSSDYVYNGSWYPMYPPDGRPPFGRPVFPPGYRPNHPTPAPPYERPPYPAEPVRPPSTTRPPSSPRPGNNTTPPAATERPASTSRPAATERPSSTTQPDNSRPAGTSRSSSANTTTGTTTRESVTRGN